MLFDGIIPGIVGSVSFLISAGGSKIMSLPRADFLQVLLEYLGVKIRGNAAAADLGQKFLLDAVFGFSFALVDFHHGGTEFFKKLRFLYRKASASADSAGKLVKSLKDFSDSKLIFCRTLFSKNHNRSR